MTRKQTGRETIEAWAFRKWGRPLYRFKERALRLLYQDVNTQLAWEAWQAAKRHERKRK